jgi:hypothetical protein
VGLLEGAIVAAVGFPLRQRPLLAAAVMMIAHVLLTGAMHLDGPQTTVMYSAQGLGARRR